jgi:uncharacterized protein YkwD
MTSIGTPKAARALITAVASGALLAGCGIAGFGGGGSKGAAATVPAPTSSTDAAGDAAAPAAEPVGTSSKPSPSSRPSSTRPGGSGASTRRTTHRTVRVPPAPTRTTPRPAPRTTTKPVTKPAPKPTPKPAPPATTGLTSAEAQVLALVNKERASAGCGALRSNAVLVAVARAHSTDMAVHRYFDHNSQDGRSPFDRMRAAGYKGGLMGENIAAGQPTPAAVMDAWMHSPGHRANILNCGFKVIGIGVHKLASSPYRIYWTQDFGDR